jgi:hypothetical protein
MPERSHLDDLLDAALAATFPASDPVSTLVSETKAPEPATPADDTPPEEEPPGPG